MADQVVEAGVERAEILDPLDQPPAGFGEAVLMVDPVLAWHFGSGLELAGPTQDVAGLLRTEEVAHDQVAVARHAGTFLLRGFTLGGGGGWFEHGAHAISSGSRACAFATSSGKSISVQGRPLMSSKPNRAGVAASPGLPVSVGLPASFRLLAMIMSRMGSSYSMARRPLATYASARSASSAAVAAEKRKNPTDSPCQS